MSVPCCLSSSVPHFFPETPFGNWREGSIHPGDYCPLAGTQRLYRGADSGFGFPASPGMGVGSGKGPILQGHPSMFTWQRADLVVGRARLSMLRANNVAPESGPSRTLQGLIKPSHNSRRLG